jgi:cyclic-di-GMP-binding protein
MPTRSPAGSVCRMVAKVRERRGRKEVEGAIIIEYRTAAETKFTGGGTCPHSTSPARPTRSTANKEVANRFDFKGSDARFELNEKEHEIVAFADDEFKLGQVRDVLLAKMAKRGVDARFLKTEDPQKIGGDKMKQKLVVRHGVEQELAKRIVKALKDAKLKVTASIQGDVVRVTGAKKDVLQEAIALVRATVNDVPLKYENFRD